MRKIIICIISVFIFLALYYFWPGKKLEKNVQINEIIVLKSKEKLMLLNNKKIIKTYRISPGPNPLGEKHFEGDDKTPEGRYFIESKNPKSDYYLNLGISYPSEKDVIFAKNACKKPGGLIKIHGLKNGLDYIGKFLRWRNWTNGCIALTNDEISELYKHVEIGTPNEIMP